MRRTWLIAVSLVILCYFLTGVHQVAPGECAVIRRCGKPLPEFREPGLHWGLPWGFDRVDRVAVDEQRLLVIGFLEESGPGDNLNQEMVTPTGQALTGDNQIVNLRINIHYRANRQELVDYVLAKERIDEILLRIAETTLTATLAGEKIDHVLLGRSVFLESQLRDQLALRIQAFRLGILIDSVNLVYAQPPAELAEAFRDVNRAQAQRDITVTDATARKNAEVSQARQEADRIIAQGQSVAATRIIQARSEAIAFRSLLAAFPVTEPAASAALLQLYLREMQPVLSRMQVRTLSDHGVDQIVIVPLPSK